MRYILGMRYITYSRIKCLRKGDQNLKDINSSQIDLNIQCNSNQSTNKVLHEILQNILKCL